MQEVATLKGSPNSNQFTMQEARSAGVQPHSAGVQGLSSRVSKIRWIPDRGANGKLTDTQGQDYAGRVAELMKSSGVNPAVGPRWPARSWKTSRGPRTSTS